MIILCLRERKRKLSTVLYSSTKQQQNIMSCKVSKGTIMTGNYCRLLVNIITAVHHHEHHHLTEITQNTLEFDIISSPFTLKWHAHYRFGPIYRNELHQYFTNIVRSREETIEQLVEFWPDGKFVLINYAAISSFLFCFVI